MKEEVTESPWRKWQTLMKFCFLQDPLGPFVTVLPFFYWIEKWKRKPGNMTALPFLLFSKVFSKKKVGHI